MYRCRRLGRPASRITSCAWHSVCSERTELKLVLLKRPSCQRENVITRMPHASTVDTVGSLLCALSSCTVLYSSTDGFQVFYWFLCVICRKIASGGGHQSCGGFGYVHCSALPDSGEEWNLFHPFSRED